MTSGAGWESYSSVDACDVACGVDEWKEGKEGEPYRAWELHCISGPNCVYSRCVACFSVYGKGGSRINLGLGG